MISKFITKDVKAVVWYWGANAKSEDEVLESFNGVCQVEWELELDERDWGVKFLDIAIKKVSFRNEDSTIELIISSILKVSDSAEWYLLDKFDSKIAFNEGGTICPNSVEIGIHSNGKNTIEID